MRPVLAVVAGAAVAALGALILGEYPFTGVLVVASGLLLGLFVAEAFLAVSHRPGLLPALACAALAAGGMLWGAWISTGHDLALLAGAGWAAVPAGAAAAALRAAWRRGADSRSAPTPTE